MLSSVVSTGATIFAQVVAIQIEVKYGAAIVYYIVGIMALIVAVPLFFGLKDVHKEQIKENEEKT